MTCMTSWRSSRTSARNCATSGSGAAPRTVRAPRRATARPATDSILIRFMVFAPGRSPSERENQRRGKDVVPDVRDAAVLAIVQIFSLERRVLVGRVTQPRRGAPHLGHVDALRPLGGRRVAQPDQRVAKLAAREDPEPTGEHHVRLEIAAPVEAQPIGQARRRVDQAGLARAAADEPLRLEIDAPELRLRIDPEEPEWVAAVLRVVLRAVLARDPDLDGAARRDCQAGTPRLAGVAVDLVVEMKHLDGR